ncbi:TPA: helix-turn-helix domain-containing protein [Vibrio cholerae]|nr:helix-turn-helix domain-containing protein [Vibrio cholerae]
MTTTTTTTTSNIKTNVMTKVNAVRRNTALNSSENAILLELIFSVDNNTNKGFASYQSIHRSTGLSVNTIKKTLKALQEAGLLIQVAKGSNLTNQATKWELKPELIETYKNEDAVNAEDTLNEQESITEVLPREAETTTEQLSTESAVVEQDEPREEALTSTNESVRPSESVDVVKVTSSFLDILNTPQPMRVIKEYVSQVTEEENVVEETKADALSTAEVVTKSEVKASNETAQEYDYNRFVTYVKKTYGLPVEVNADHKTFKVATGNLALKRTWSTKLAVHGWSVI